MVVFLFILKELKEFIYRGGNGGECGTLLIGSLTTGVENTLVILKVLKVGFMVWKKMN